MSSSFKNIPSVIRQKGKSQNGCYKKTKHAKFYEKRTVRTVTNVHLSENLACFVFSLPPFWDLPFSLVTDNKLRKKESYSIIASFTSMSYLEWGDIPLKKVFLKIYLQVYNLIKHVTWNSCDFCKIFKKIHFQSNLQTAASENSLESICNGTFFN